MNVNRETIGLNNPKLNNETIYTKDHTYQIYF